MPSICRCATAATAFIKEAELINPGAGTKSRVYYKHLPRKFVAGTLYDSKEKEVIIGAESGVLRLLKHWGKKSKTIKGIITDRDLSLGDITFE